MAFPILGAVGLGAGLLDSLFGNRSTTMKYAPNAYERQLLSLLQPSLTYQGALGEVQRGLKPQIQGMQNLGRQAGVPYGGGAEIQTRLKTGTSIADLLAQAGLQRQGQAQGLFASLAGGRGTQTTTPPTNLGGLGQLLGLILAMQGGNVGGQPMNRPSRY